MTRKEKLNKARLEEREANDKLKYEEVKAGTPEWQKAYDDWAEKYWEHKKQLKVDDDLFDAEGCLSLFIFAMLLGFMGIVVVKLLFFI
jgi:hypothetical protein